MERGIREQSEYKNKKKYVRKMFISCQYQSVSIRFLALISFFFISNTIFNQETREEKTFFTMDLWLKIVSKIIFLFCMTFQSFSRRTKILSTINKSPTRPKTFASLLVLCVSFTYNSKKKKEKVSPYVLLSRIQKDRTFPNDNPIKMIICQ